MAKKDPIQEIIEKSGNTFHSKVIQFLREKGWTVLISPYYSDNQTNKPREIDIIAEKNFGVATMDSKYGVVRVQLFIECKYISNETVFWFDEKDKNSAEQMIMRNTGLEEHASNVMIEKHHNFWDTRVGKLFSSSKDPQKTHESEDFYRALNQALNGTINLRKKGFISNEQKKLQHHFIDDVYYPIILCSDFSKLYKIDIGDDKFKNINDSDFELEVNYSYINKSGQENNEYFLLDIVDFTKFEQYLEKIEKNDIATLKSRAHWRGRF